MLGLLIATSIGCTSAAERCRRAQSEAQQGWNDYLTVLTQRRAVVTKTQAEVQLETRKVSKAIDAIASEETHRLYDPGAAWQRHYSVAYTQACRRDPTCADLEKRAARVNAEAETIDRKIALVTTARDQAASVPVEAWAAAKAVETEKNVELSVAAEQAATRAADACDVARDD